MTTHTGPSPVSNGTGLFTSITHEAGVSILTIPQPLITIPDDAHLSETCSGCLAWKPASDKSSKNGVNSYYSSGKELLNCTGCRTVKYCDQACQRMDWKLVHKKECGIFSKLAPRVLPASVRALVRLLLLQPTMDKETWRKVQERESHFLEFSNTRKWGEICLMAKGAKMYSGTQLAEAEVLKLYCMMLVNTLTLTTPTLDPIGLCFDPLAATANHSCSPNASIIFSGRSLQFRSLEKISNGTEITIPYVDTTFPTKTRQEELRLRWFFNCNCPTCQQSPRGKTDLYSCPFCSGSIPDTSPLHCPTCNKPLPNPPPETTDLKTLHKSGYYPIHRQPLPFLHSELVQSFLADGNFQEALKHQLLLHVSIYPLLYSQSFHPIRVCSGFVLAALLMEVVRDPGEELKKVQVDWGKTLWALLLEIQQGVGKSHGETSGFAAMVKAKMGEVREELVRGGVDWLRGDGTVEGLEREWPKVEEVVGTVLRGMKA
ncbi:hypothetical protein BZA77DRAFT_300333 [Pyronema omphalodes]|nr:hypothetical protein BZA77DRAFT_300333 [Pyronema omphalodes]